MTIFNNSFLLLFSQVYKMASVTVKPRSTLHWSQQPRSILHWSHLNQGQPISSFNIKGTVNILETKLRRSRVFRFFCRRSFHSSFVCRGSFLLEFRLSRKFSRGSRVVFPRLPKHKFYTRPGVFVTVVTPAVNLYLPLEVRTDK